MKRFKCSTCKVKCRKLYLDECWNCHRKNLTIVQWHTGPSQDIVEATRKIRKVRTYVTPDGYIKCSLAVPNCLREKKVRVIVVEDDDEV